MLDLSRLFARRKQIPTDYRWLDPRSLREVETAEDLVNSDETVVWYAHGKENRAYLRRKPDAHVVPGGAAIFPPLDDFPIEDPPVYAIATSNCYHVGFRTILTDEATAFNDDWLVADVERRVQAARFNSNIRNMDELTPLRASEDLSELKMTASFRGRVKKIPGVTFILTSDEPRNYGSFLFRVVPKLATWRATGLDGSALLPANFATMRAYLSMLGLEQNRYIQHDPETVYQFERAIVLNNRNRQAYLDPEVVELHRSIARRHAGTRRRKLFVSREALDLTKTGYRRMVNAEEVASALTREGFEIVMPETMTMEAQIEAFAAADVVVGQSGGAMFNCCFCDPGTRVVDIESEPHWIHAHLCFMSSLDLAVTIFEGQTMPCDDRPYHLPFRVEVDALMSHLRDVAKR